MLSKELLAGVIDKTDSIAYIQNEVRISSEQLLDYFAGQALNALLPSYCGKLSKKSIVSWAYEYAQEMLKQRKEIK